ncbi:hypothetical protein C8Q77DRAFT_1116698 [Trametes polyzona]|nr:hypothetical protein C8Q77DRAFT_1116698 [Trametes polyzona]
MSLSSMKSCPDDGGHGSAEQPGQRENITPLVERTYAHLGAVHMRVEETQGSRTTQWANRAGDWSEATQDNMSTIRDTTLAVEQSYKSEAMKAVRKGLKSFAETLPGVLDALDKVSDIHPFLKVAVSAFRVVVELNIKRRDNEKKITVLFVEMKDTMEVLIQLGDVKDVDTPGPDGVTIKARLQELIKRTAEDIKACANACDAYSKKRLVAKVLRSSSWDEKFKHFLTLFARRREDFIRALSMHTSKGVDEANRTLSSIQERLDKLIAIYSDLVPRDQEQLRRIVQAKGGADAVESDDSVLASLVKFKPASRIPSTDDDSSDEEVDESELQLVKEELFESTDVAMQKNMQTFARKFAAQQKQLMVEIEGVIRHESDRVVKGVLAGPHERIKDPIISKLWEDMRWRGHVKARHFVFALRDHYLEYANDDEGDHDEDTEDLWALRYIDVNSVSAIAEACDDDASGFITVAEVNAFITSKPSGWSLLKWLAWWSAGWQHSVSRYADQINAVLNEMFAMLPTMREENRALAFNYLDAVWDDIAMLTHSIHRNPDVDDDELADHFDEHIHLVERHLRERLEAVRYHIDAHDTLALITGPGRIEKVLFPMLYLLLSRHLGVFHLCQSRVIVHLRELSACASSIMCILQAADERGYFLERIFRQRNLNSRRQFESFACGLFNTWFNDEADWTLRKLMENVEGNDPAFSVNSIDHHLLDPKELLLFPTASEVATTPGQEAFTENDVSATGIVKELIGRWYGFFEDGDCWPGFPMFTFYLHSAGEHAFASNTRTADDIPCIVTGQAHVNTEGQTIVTSTWTFGSLDIWRLTGVLSEDKQSITGKWSRLRNPVGVDRSSDPYEQYFHLTRLAADVLVARPPPWQLTPGNRVNALWSFLREAVLRTFRKPFSRVYITDYVARRNRYVELLMKDEERDDDWEPTTRVEFEEEAELEELEGSFTYEEAVVCHIILDIKQRAAASTPEYECDVCHDMGNGAHYMCIPCSIKCDDSVVLCDKPECRDALADLDDTIHLPTHDMIRLRRKTVFYRELPRLFNQARETIRRAQAVLNKSSTRRRHVAQADADDVDMGGDSPVSPRRKGSQMSLGSDAVASSRTATHHSIRSDLTDVSMPSSASKRTAARRGRRSGAPACISCSKEVRRPCLACVECDDGVREVVFVCDECDRRSEGVSAGQHLSSHTLVRCMPSSRLLWGLADTLGAPSVLLLGGSTTMPSDSAEGSSTPGPRTVGLDARLSRLEQLLEKLSISPEGS